ncbi:MAG TPA: hypothetical protein VIG94_03855 [Faecalibacter sp.]
MTIKNFIAIVLKFIGLFFILFIFTSFIPEQINYLFNMDLFYPGIETFIPFPLITIIVVLIILFGIYYTTIYKTELMLKFLKIDKHFGDQKIESEQLQLPKFTQIGVLLVCITILIFQLPIFIKELVTYISAEGKYQESLTYIFLGSGISSFLALMGFMFSDKIASALTKK